MSEITRRRLTILLFVSGAIIGVIGGAGVAEAVFYQSHGAELALTSVGAVVLGLALLVLSNVVYRIEIANRESPADHG
jgi:hypothetical protein